MANGWRGRVAERAARADDETEFRPETSIVRLTATILMLAAVASPQARAACVSPAGAPACGEQADPGSGDARDLVGRHVGNPIDVISGNKYQPGLDYRAPDSPLAFVRHYNSSLVDQDIGLGRGWRHGYAARLTRERDGTLIIVQGDGRMIVFSADGTVNAATGVSWHTAADPGDGAIEAGERYVWHLADGRAMTFVGSYLVEIGYPDGQRLRLRYERRRLASVTDDRGRRLRLVYAEGRAGLGHYEGERTPPGHVDRLVLPDGSSVRYRYDARLNLVGTDDDAGAGLRHDYADTDWPNHLTALDHADGRPVGRWAYDGLGRAVRWRSGERPSALRIDHLDDARRVSGGQTRVLHWEAGTVSSELFDWTTSEDGTAQRVISRRPVHPIGTREPSWEGMKPLAGPRARASGIVRPRDVDEAMARLAVSTVEVEVPVGDDASVPVVLYADRFGHTVDMKAGRLRMSDLVEMAAGDVQRYRMAVERGLRGPRRSSGEVSMSLADKVTRLVEVEKDQRLDPEMLADHVLTLAELQPLAEALVSPLARGGIQLRGKQFGNGPSCPLPRWSDCDTMRENRVMAELSACAYPGKPCNTALREVSPESVGLRPELFVIGDVSAKLYLDPVTNRYTLAFRGTENTTDWYENVRNGLGLSSDQYTAAARLADLLEQRLERRFPDSELSFTGHSLGGGLATLAALRTDRSAVVFNSAGLHERTATWNSASLDSAGFLVRNVKVSGDPVSTAQRGTGGWNALVDRLFPGEQSGVFVGNAPGYHTEIPKPPQTWIDARIAASPGGDLDEYVAVHSIDAVRESLDLTIATHCRSRTP